MYPLRRTTRSSASRERVLAAVRHLLEAGTFHQSTVEAVAARAGVSRATLYQHFGSRIGLVDAICELMAENPALAALRETDDVAEFLARVTDFWSAEERLVAQLYGARAVDPAARDFVERQRRDRYGELRRLLAAHGRTDKQTLAAFAALTSFDTYLELRRARGLSKREVIRTLERMSSAFLT
jgi:AcrR family transcriptional regulator